MATRVQIWTFPLRRKGLLITLAGIALVALATTLGSLHVPILPTILTTLVAVYACAVSYLVVRDTARGADTIASWPGLPNREAFFAPVGRVVVGTLWGCLPALLYRIFVDDPAWIFWGLFLLGVYFLPMVLVRVATRESFLAGQPMAVLICILRTLRDYTATCAPFYLAVFLTAFAATYLAKPDNEMWLGAGLAYAASVYLILVEFYLLGLFHRRNREKLHLTPFPTAPETTGEPDEPAEPATVAAPSEDPPVPEPAEDPSPDARP